MKKILLIEDDKVTHHLVQISLQADFELIKAYTLKEGSQLLVAHSDISLIIIDRMLPDGDGIGFCSTVRTSTQHQDLPIIFLSSSATEVDKVSGLFAGGDDYMTKPFSPLELKARVQARLRQKNKVQQLGNAEIHFDSQRIFDVSSLPKIELTLTRIEFKLLTTFIQANDRVLNRQFLLSKVWGEDCFINDRVVDTHISNLRKKISPLGLNVSSVRNEGYRLTTSRPALAQAA